MNTPTISARQAHRESLLLAALDYASRGWHVIPLRPRSKQPATPNHPVHLCDNTDPKCVDGHTGWEQRATTNPARIKQAWTTRPYGIGIATGPSNLVVLDLDIPKTPGHLTGHQRLHQLAHEAGQHLPPTLTVTTPTGGRHLYYTAPAPGSALGNTASRLGAYIDTRANGGYIVAPPTRLPNGAYELHTYVDVDDLPELPAWIAARLQTPPRRPATNPPPAQAVGPQSATAIDRYVQAAINGEASRLQVAVEGDRNNTLFTAAIAIGQLVGAGAITHDNAHQALLTAATGHINTGAYSSIQANQTINSGLHRGQQQPRQLPTTDRKRATR